ncbi:hypothetical protein [Ktedonobacter racemifer]|uniref:Uncharacterized protein n=1 Tax=Ktedonobacter racemifer DSM 44963 TaxID=485913 RepID=D6TU12_KTERA|nr:hypothetical protein [Ktedonobacter racemifer]EFH83913.1 hypothetical protein Krac_4917 [Ktedonobacter racemifer DSM 44963]
MQQAVEQNSQQEPQASSSVDKSGWARRREEREAARLARQLAKTARKDQAASLNAFDVTRTEPGSFYEQAIEWTHRADKIINLVLGYLLAIASVLGFMDVLSNGEVLGHVPFLFYIWLLIMGLGVDFQILLVIGRVPDLARMVGHPVGKWVLVIFNIVFLAFLAYVSIIIGAVFTQHRDVPGTIAQAMQMLGINSTSFVYERAALATCLLILMAIDRTMERWRMQIAVGNRQQQLDKQQVQISEVETQVESVQPAQNVQASDLTQVVQAMQEMNEQNLAAMHAMNNEMLNRFSQVTVELVRETIERTVATVALPSAESPALPAGKAEDEATSESRPSLNEQNLFEDEPGRTTEALSAIDFKFRGAQPFTPDYGKLIADMYQENNEITVLEIVDQLRCARSTATKWLKRVKEEA